MPKSKVAAKKLARSKVESQTESAIASQAHDLDEQDIAALAYELWQARGCPHASPQEDWFRAVEMLRSRS